MILTFGPLIHHLNSMYLLNFARMFNLWVDAANPPIQFIVHRSSSHILYRSLSVHVIFVLSNLPCCRSSLSFSFGIPPLLSSGQKFVASCIHFRVDPVTILFVKSVPSFYAFYVLLPLLRSLSGGSPVAFLFSVLRCPYLWRDFLRSGLQLAWLLALPVKYHVKHPTIVTLQAFCPDYQSPFYRFFYNSGQLVQAQSSVSCTVILTIVCPGDDSICPVLPSGLRRPQASSVAMVFWCLGGLRHGGLF